MSRDAKILPVILAGGKGSRLWPLSRLEHPKPLLKIMGEHSLFQGTLQRVWALEDTLPAFIVYNDRFLTALNKQITEIDSQDKRKTLTQIIESEGRNTAASAALAAIEALRQFGNVKLLILPADHLISDVAAFKVVIDHLRKSLNHHAIATIGVKPKTAETAYGYIRAGAVLQKHIYSIERFIEKPDLQAAKRLFTESKVFWNTGMFMVYAETYMNLLQDLAPSTACKTLSAMKHASRHGTTIKPNANLFEQCPSISIDHAIMEKTNQGIVIETTIPWSDVGSWESIWRTSDKDSKQNVIKGDVVANDIENCYIYSSSRNISALGIKDLIIIDTQDALLVVNKNDSQSVKELADKMLHHKPDIAVFHAKVERPWGFYETLNKVAGCHIKRITIQPGHCISLQYHHHRSEHWVFISGIAEVTKGDNIFEVRSGESVFIPPKVIHRLKNNSNEILELIEVQLGDYIGEDDIVRLEDHYGRVAEMISFQ